MGIGVIRFVSPKFKCPRNLKNCEKKLKEVWGAADRLIRKREKAKHEYRCFFGRNLKNGFEKEVVFESSRKWVVSRNFRVFESKA